jgi:hypothetical protein
VRVAPQIIVPQCGEAFDEMGGKQPLSTSYQHKGKNLRVWRGTCQSWAVRLGSAASSPEGRFLSRDPSTSERHSFGSWVKQLISRVQIERRRAGSDRREQSIGEAISRANTCIRRVNSLQKLRASTCNENPPETRCWTWAVPHLSHPR